MRGEVDHQVRKALLMAVIVDRGALAWHGSNAQSGKAALFVEHSLVPSGHSA